MAKPSPLNPEPQQVLNSSFRGNKLLPFGRLGHTAEPLPLSRPLAARPQQAQERNWQVEPTQTHDKVQAEMGAQYPTLPPRQQCNPLSSQPKAPYATEADNEHVIVDCAEGLIILIFD